MPDNTMLQRVKTALRITTNAFDDEVQSLIDDCISELEMLGIYHAGLNGDPQILNTVIYYSKARFGANADSEKWEKIYYDKLTKLQIASGYGRIGGGACGQK